MYKLKQIYITEGGDSSSHSWREINLLPRYQSTIKPQLFQLQLTLWAQSSLLIQLKKYRIASLPLPWLLNLSLQRTLV